MDTSQYVTTPALILANQIVSALPMGEVATLSAPVYPDEGNITAENIQTSKMAELVKSFMAVRNSSFNVPVEDFKDEYQNLPTKVETPVLVRQSSGTIKRKKSVSRIENSSEAVVGEMEQVHLRTNNSDVPSEPRDFSEHSFKKGVKTNSTKRNDLILTEIVDVDDEVESVFEFYFILLILVIRGIPNNIIVRFNEIISLYNSV